MLRGLCNISVGERWDRISVQEIQNKGTEMSGKMNSLERNHLVFGCSLDELLSTQGGTLDILHMPIMSVSFYGVSLYSWLLELDFLVFSNSHQVRIFKCF